MSPNWAYGILTVPERIESHLPRTIRSLQAGGFINPHLFVDGGRMEDYKKFLLPVSIRNPHIGQFGNWYLAVCELYCRNWRADYYAMFEDDIITYKNLKQYLERSNMPKDGYCNLYTVPQNEELCPKGHTGWFESNQYGVGALGLVFPKEVLLTLITQRRWLNQPTLAHGSYAVDGAVVDAIGVRFNGETKIKEYCHSPTLVQHTGEQTTIPTKRNMRIKYNLPETFCGEDFDALDMKKIENVHC